MPARILTMISPGTACGSAGTVRQLADRDLHVPGRLRERWSRGQRERHETRAGKTERHAKMRLRIAASCHGQPGIGQPSRSSAAIPPGSARWLRALKTEAFEQATSREGRPYRPVTYARSKTALVKRFTLRSALSGGLGQTYKVLTHHSLSRRPGLDPGSRLGARVKPRVVRSGRRERGRMPTSRRLPAGSGASGH